MTSLTEEDDVLAGEFALGTLDRATRADVVARRSADPAFDLAVTWWEQRLAPLIEAAPDVDPPAGLWDAILTRIGSLNGLGFPPHDGATVIAFDRRLLRWKQATAASLALAACLAVWVGVVTLRDRGRPGQTLIAVLQKTDEAPAFVMRASLGRNTVSVSPVSAPAVPGKSYELWIIDRDIGPPKSLGVLNDAGQSRTTLPSVPEEVLTRATYAVTLEQQGGSPTGQPTSAPVLFGHLLHAEP